MTKQDIILLGGGGHARLLSVFLARADFRLLGFVGPDPTDARPSDIEWLGDDDWLAGALQRYPDTKLVNGIGSIGVTKRRRVGFCRAVAAGWSFADYCHPSAMVDGHSTVGIGLQILARAIVQPGCRIGNNVLVNTAAVLEHNVTVADHVHIAPRACICGDARIEEAVHIGAGAIVLQSCNVGRGAVVGAGAVVIHDVAPGETVTGVPARPFTVRRTDG